MPASILESAIPEAPPAAAPRRFLTGPAGFLGGACTLTMAILALFAGAIAPHNPFKPVARPLSPPSWSHWMGTDNLGRDILSGVVHGASTSLRVVLWVILLSSVLGVVLGAMSGYLGGAVDSLIMWVTELLQSVPRFFMAVLVVAYLGRGVGNLILLLGLTSWPLLARVVRAECLSLRTRQYVDAARSAGASQARMLVRHVLPQVVPSVIVVVAVTGSRIVLLESSLAFLGLGDPNLMSWGYLISNAQNYLRLAWWMSVFPGLVIAVSVIGLNLLGDALHQAVRPSGIKR